MKLRLGKMKSKEIAEWFRITPSTFFNNKAKRLEELQAYCKFEDIGKKGVNILEIYHDEYAGKVKYNMKKWFNELSEEEQKLSTVDLANKFPKENVTVTFGTLRVYFAALQQEKFGRGWHDEIAPKSKTFENSQMANKGIYGIYYDGEVVYIGKTVVSFDERFKQHWQGIAKGKKMLVYQELHKLDKHKIEMKPILTLDSIMVNQDEITNRDVESMELALISLYKPKYNRAGMTMPYIYGHQKDNEESL